MTKLATLRKRLANGPSRSPSPDTEQRFLETWQPEPLVPDLGDTDDLQHVLQPHLITSKPGKTIVVDGVQCLNLATHNYLGLADEPRLEAAAIAAARKYGVGSCGPRAFYGTMDVHLKLEEELADFLGLQETVLYSFNFATIASAIPAYAKAGDVIFADEHCNFAILQGIIASKSRVIKFRHNDTKHLAELCDQLDEEQMKRFGKRHKIRTFLIVEGIYANTGSMCPLKEMIVLKRKHKIRLFVDESRSFGVIGATGRGITEHLDVDIHDVDLVMASLENALCAFGGFCAGSTFVVDHQRLAGSGYCFSASLPPLQTQVALESLRMIREDPELVTNSQKLFSYAHEQLKSLSKLKDISHPLSAVKLLVVASDDGAAGYDKEHEAFLKQICDKMIRQEKIALSIARYLENEEMTAPRASIRLIVSGCLSRSDVDRVCNALNKYSLE